MMSDAVGNVTYDLNLPRNCTIPDENGCNDRSGRTQSPQAAQVRSNTLLPQHQRSLSFRFTTRHIERYQFSLKTVYIANTTVCIKRVTNTRTTVNVCILQTVT
jgi:hypothetical protein